MFLLLLGINLSIISGFLNIGCVAQLVEQRPFKPLAEGSNPSTLTPALCEAFLWQE
ncbi:MAG: hypothetical protein XD77_1149 [Marinimicrobia bacterium 46_47]|nr:MAG: hypothetical protein XD77_1149 [Marinimicrobia bacterium 46_47]KUK91392.1 MAG: hypothetical protein XE04_1112 [Marinimicrobia bacterium 46_43]